MTQTLPPVGAPAGISFPGTSTPPAAATGPSVGAAPPALRPIVDRDKFNAAVAKIQTYAQENYGYAMPLTQAEAIVQGDPNADLKMKVRVRTMAFQDQEQAKKIQEAGLTGLWNGQPTLESRRVSSVEEQNTIEREKLAETARQFDTTELRIASQFASTLGLDQAQFLEVVRANKAGEAIETTKIGQQAEQFAQELGMTKEQFLAKLKQDADQFDADIGLRRDTLALSREQFQESARQFNLNYDAEADRFSQQLGLSRDQFLEVVRANKAGETIEDARLKQAADQFTEDMGLKKEELGLRREDLEATKEERKAAQLRWEKEFGAQTDQFAKTFGLDEKKLEEGIRQFNTGQAFEDKKLEAQVTQFYEELGVTKEELQFRQDSFTLEYNQRAEQFASEFGLTKEQFTESVRQFDAGQQLANRELETRIAQFKDEMAERQETRLESMRQFNLTYDQRVDEFAKDLGMRKEVFLESVRQYNAGETLNYAQLRVDQSTLDESIRQFNIKIDADKEAQSWQDARDEKDYLRKVFLTELEGTLQGGQQQAEMDWKSVENYLQREHEKDLQDASLAAQQRQSKEEQRYAAVGIAVRGLAHFINQKWLAADEVQKYMGQLDAMMGNTAAWGTEKYWKDLGFGNASAGMAEHFTKYPAPKIETTPQGQTPAPGGTPPPAGATDATPSPGGTTPPVGAVPPDGTAATTDALTPGGGAGKLPANQVGAPAPGTNPDNLNLQQPAVPEKDLLPGEQTNVPNKNTATGTDTAGGIGAPTGGSPATPTGTVDWNRLKSTLTPRNLLTFGLQAVTGALTAKGNIAGMGSDPWVSAVTDALGGAQALALSGPIGIAGYMAGRLAEGMYQWYGGGRQEFWNQAGYHLPAGYADNKISPEIAAQLNLQQSGDQYLGVGAPFINFQKNEVVWTRADGQGQAIESLDAFAKRTNSVPISFYGAEDEVWDSLPAELRQQLDFKPKYAVVNKDGSVLFMDRGGREKGLKTKVIEPADAQKYFAEYLPGSTPSPAGPGGTDDRGVNQAQELRNNAKRVSGLSDVELDNISATLPAARRTILFNRLASGNLFTDIDEDSIFRDPNGPISAPAWQAWTTLKDQKRIKFQSSAAVGG